MPMRRYSAAAAAVLLAACSSGGRGATGGRASSNPVASARARTAAACVIVQPADATAVFGLPASRVAVSNTAGAQSVCGFAGSTTADTTDFTAVNHSLNVYVYDGTTHYSPASSKHPVAVPGLGDRAFRSANADQLVVEFVKGDQTVLLAYSITAIGAHGSPGAAADRLVAVARAAARRM